MKTNKKIVKIWNYSIIFLILFVLQYFPVNSLRHGYVYSPYSSEHHSRVEEFDNPEVFLDRLKRDINTENVNNSSAGDTKDKHENFITTIPTDNHNGSVLFDRDYDLNNSMITLVHLNDSHEQLTGKF